MQSNRGQGSNSSLQGWEKVWCRGQCKTRAAKWLYSCFWKNWDHIGSPEFWSKPTGVLKGKSCHPVVKRWVESVWEDYPEAWTWRWQVIWGKEKSSHQDQIYSLGSTKKQETKIKLKGRANKKSLDQLSFKMSVCKETVAQPGQQTIKLGVHKLESCSKDTPSHSTVGHLLHTCAGLGFWVSCL